MDFIESMWSTWTKVTVVTAAAAAASEFLIKLHIAWNVHAHKRIHTFYFVYLRAGL